MSLAKEMGRSRWSLLRRAPLTVWLGVTTADTIPGSLRKEAAAFDEALGEGARHYDHNQLITTIADEAKRPSGSQLHRWSGVSAPRLQRDLMRIAKVLESRCDPLRAHEFRTFLLNFGWAIARAASESPLGGCKVSVGEERFLYGARRALHGEEDAKDAPDPTSLRERSA